MNYLEISEERKQKQLENLVPKWYTTGGYQMFKQKYEYGTDQSVRGQFTRIANTAASHLEGKVLVDPDGVSHDSNSIRGIFFDLLWEGDLSPSTPVLANTGTNRGMPVSCSGTVVEDSINGFYSNLLEVANLTKQGFGTASDFSHIRPRGSKISVGGKSNGVLPVIKDHVNAMRNVSQGNARRGAWACYLNIEHGDFWEVVNHLINEPDDLNIGWTVPQSFIDALEANEQEAVRRFKRVMKVKIQTGKGYFFFIDKANEKRPVMYKDLGLFINNSQLCVAPETLILTDEGYQQIGTLEDEFIKVWNGKEFSIVQVKKTGTNQKLIRVVTNSGFELECTPYHKFYVQVDGVVIEKRANQLEKGDALIESEPPVEMSEVMYSMNDSIKEVIDEGRFDDTYCFTEPKRGMGVFNGILTGQCSEIMLFNDAEHTYTCVLSSINVARWGKLRKHCAFWATVFLDCIAEEFIQRAKGLPGLEKAVKFTEKGRALGLGVCGLHTLFMQERMPFESFEAHNLSTIIQRRISKESIQASKELARVLGEPEWCKGYGVRNTHLIAIAPTKTTALLMGGVSEGINPTPAFTYTQSTSAGEIDRVDPVLLELLKERNQYNPRVVQSIVDNQGSVQHLEFLTEHEKQVFRTAFEISQRAIIRMASARAKYIDQWQSLNLFFSAEADPKLIAAIHREAFLNPDILALYYIYTQAGVQASKETCEACQ